MAERDRVSFLENKRHSRTQTASTLIGTRMNMCKHTLPRRFQLAFRCSIHCRNVAALPNARRCTEEGKCAGPWATLRIHGLWPTIS